MKDDSPFYITTTLPYVNADPHIGFALEAVQADAIARAKRLSGRSVFFNTGADEHGQKIWENAQKQGKDTQTYVDEYAASLQKLEATLNLSYTKFIRTTDPIHKEAAQELWRRCDATGDIYKKRYTGLYCIGCERFITEKELEDGECPHHRGRMPEEVEEENYFFRLSRYEDKLKEYLSQPGVIVPDHRRKEALLFVENGLEDFSISREKERMPWGVPVPGDDDQVMYVWFDALTNYISTLGWPEDKEGNFTKFWENGEVVQVAGKDQVRFQSIMWQAMLLSAGLPTTDTVFYHGFLTHDGQKMSKSMGNVVSPVDVARKYGTDALRYYLLREVMPFEDGDFTDEKFKEAYNANLANGLGNLVSRILKMAINYDVSVEFTDKNTVIADPQIGGGECFADLETFEISKAMDGIWAEIGELDNYISVKQPYKKIKEDEEGAKKDVQSLLTKLWHVAIMLEPFLPEAAQTIQTLLTERRMPEAPLFERKR